MADNLTTTTTVSTIPNATKISTDEDATNGHVQRVKLAVSTDGSSAHIGANSTGIFVQGSVAEDAAVAGNPTLVGGRYDATARGLDDGDVGGMALDITGSVQIKTFSTVTDLTLSLETTAYASGDVLAATQELTGAVRVSGGTGVIQSIGLIDDDDQGQALDIVIFDSNVALGTENAAVSIADGDADNILGIVEITGSDYIDLVNSQWAQINNVGIVVKPTTGTSLYVAAISRGTGTYTASGITLRLGIIQD